MSREATNYKHILSAIGAQVGCRLTEKHSPALKAHRSVPSSERGFEECKWQLSELQSETELPARHAEGFMGSEGLTYFCGKEEKQVLLL